VKHRHTSTGQPTRTPDARGAADGVLSHVQQQGSGAGPRRGSAERLRVSQAKVHVPVILHFCAMGCTVTSDAGPVRACPGGVGQGVR